MTDTLAHWFSLHPFWRNEMLLIGGAVAALAKKDWDAFKQHKIGEPDATFSIRVALWQYSQAIIIGGGPPFVAEFWRILGGMPPV